MKHAQPEIDPFNRWSTILVFGMIVLGIVALCVAAWWGERLQGAHGNRPAVAGHPVQTRVTRESSQHQPYTMYKGECLVEYSVDNKLYSLWTGALADPDEHWVRERMESCPISAFVVHYNPKDPADALARAKER